MNTIAVQSRAAVDAETIAAIPPVATAGDVEMATQTATHTESKTEDPFLVAFDPNFDAENPKDWSTAKKWTVTDVLSATGFNRIMVSTIMAPALTTISSDLHMSNIESVMALSIYILGTVFGPLIIGPLSEVYGRKPILHVSNIWFLVFNIACGFANSKGLLIAARFLAGFGASAIYALAGGVLGDIWRPEQRGRSLGIYLLIPLLGVAVGPIIGGFIVAYTNWRWIFWSTSIFQVAMVVLSFVAYHESFGPLILHRRAKKLRKESGNSRYYTKFERQDADSSVVAIIGRSLTRPLRLLAFHPIVQIVALLTGFGYGLLYLVLTTFAELWTSAYHENTQISGLHYVAVALGEVLGSQAGGPVMDYVYRRLKAGRAVDEEVIPEHHLPLLVPSIILANLFGFILYGWAAQYRVAWPVVDLGVFILSFGGQIAGMPIQAYIIDSYPEHTSSATAATQFSRSLAAFSFPLFAPQMYQALGYGWGNTMLAFISMAIYFPSTFVLWQYGARLRRKARSTY